MESGVLEPFYGKSWAVIIGIDKYVFGSPLLNACSDAKAVADILLDQFGFEQDCVTLLLDEDATRKAISFAFSQLATTTSLNDRVLFFFAGHGHTVPSPKGDTGFLIPHDGLPSDYSSLIRWDEFTRNADLIPAKHILFLMDACYGGLATLRALPEGRNRYLRDMLTRKARQVITAGKGDEQVSDAGGPLAGHSVFTGFLLEGLGGKAKAHDEVITANSLLPYIYENVSRSPKASQTPHFGYLDGDGDFVFSFPALDSAGTEETSTDILLSVPPNPLGYDGTQDGVETDTKRFLSSSDGSIPLHDLAVEHTRRSLELIREADLDFKAGAISPSEIQRRLSIYEIATRPLQKIVALVGHWGGGKHLDVLTHVLSRMVDFSREPQSGSSVLLSLQWYPAMLLVYAAGIAATKGRNWPALAGLLSLRARGYLHGYAVNSLVLALGDASASLHEAFKALPDHRKNYVPRSEYLHTRLHGLLDDLFFLGSEYSDLFDRFEATFSLVHIDMDSDYQWSPLGRFAYRFARRDRVRRQDPLSELIEEFHVQQNSWSPLTAGLLGGSTDRAQRAFEALVKSIPQHWVL